MHNFKALLGKQYNLHFVYNRNKQNMSTQIVNFQPSYTYYGSKRTCAFSYGRSTRLCFILEVHKQSVDIHNLQFSFIYVIYIILRIFMQSKGHNTKNMQMHFHLYEINQIQNMRAMMRFMSSTKVGRRTRIHIFKPYVIILLSSSTSSTSLLLDS